MNDTSGHPLVGDAVAISAVNLSLGSGANRVHILKDIALNIGRGEAVSLLGPSGSGKSTLLMVMAGLERPDNGSVVVAGADLGRLDEDGLARFRGANIGIVFQAFHLIPTMTALENVAVPLELSGTRDALSRAEAELAAVGLRDRLDHYPAQLSGGEQQRVAIARALAPNPAILVADEPTGNLDETTGAHIIELLFRGKEQHRTTLVLVTHDAALAARCDRVLHMHSGRLAASPTGSRRTADETDMTAVAMRFAWREARGGLRGFGVFIACIALGVFAIAGVGSLSAALSDGLAQSGAVLLGGDVAFTLPLRQADSAERAFLAAHGTASEIAVLPTMARIADGKSALIEAKAVDGAYPLVGTVKTDPEMTLTALFARDGDVFGAAADPSLLARLQLKVGDRISVGNAMVEIRAVLLGEPDKLGGGIGFGPRVLLSEEALRASGLIQPGSLVRWRYRLRLPAGESDDRALAAIEKQALSEFPKCRLGHSYAQERLAAARTQCGALQPISGADRLCRPFGRRRRGR